MVVRLDQDRNYPEFLIYHFINEDCFDSFDSNPLPGCMRAEPQQTRSWWWWWSWLSECTGQQCQRARYTRLSYTGDWGRHTPLHHSTTQLSCDVIVTERTTEIHNQVSNQLGLSFFWYFVVHAVSYLDI